MLLTAIVIGCETEDRRLAEQAARNTELQAQQNQQMARVNREVAQGTKRLVEADAEARRQMLSLQQDLQSERQQVAAGRDALEDPGLGGGEVREPGLGESGEDPVLHRPVGDEQEQAQIQRFGGHRNPSF